MKTITMLAACALALAATLQAAAAQDAFVESDLAGGSVPPQTAQLASPRGSENASHDSVESAEGTTVGTIAVGPRPPICASVPAEWEHEGCIPPLPDTE